MTQSGSRIAESVLASINREDFTVSHAGQLVPIAAMRCDLTDVLMLLQELSYVSSEQWFFLVAIASLCAANSTVTVTWHCQVFQFPVAVQ